MSANFALVVFSASTSLVCVSFSLATAPRSPALSSGTCACVFPCSTSRCPRRSDPSLVRLWTVASDFSVPVTTRSMVMRPANGSAIVFQTNAVYGAAGSALMPVGDPSSASAGNSRSAGDGT